MTPLEWGAVLVALAFTFYFLGRLPTIRAVAVFFGLVLLAGGGGHLMSFGAKAVNMLNQLGGTAIAWTFGAAIPGLIAIVLGAIMIHDWLPRNAAKKRTFWISVVMGLMVALGVTGIPAAANLPQQTSNGVTNIMAGG
jgi:uncharacterized BrkB/YihY/UPF0761 family membrane protein